MPHQSVTHAYLGLGSNMGDGPANLRRALELLGAVPGLSVEAVSPVFRTEPQGLTDQDWFANCAARIRMDGTWTPETLLDAMAIAAGRLLRYVYLGNVNRPSDTICPKCGSIVVSRRGYDISRTGLNAEGGCRNCGAHLYMTMDDTSRDEAS